MKSQKEMKGSQDLAKRPGLVKLIDVLFISLSGAAIAFAASMLLSGTLTLIEFKVYSAMVLAFLIMEGAWVALLLYSYRTRPPTEEEGSD